MILEGIVTSLDDQGQVRISPMGPDVDPGFRRMILKPFTTSRTFENLKRTRQGVFHVTDDTELLARAAVQQWDEQPALRSATRVAGMILADACRWYGFEVESVDESSPRTVMTCRVVEHGFHREFFGWNRAKHAVVEAAILASRVHILPAAALRDQLTRLAPLVDKTGGESEHRAFALLREFIRTNSTAD